ncbi:hypothetical protein [Fictibacillus nanhaiensis]
MITGGKSGISGGHTLFTGEHVINIKTRTVKLIITTFQHFFD